MVSHERHAKEAGGTSSTAHAAVGRRKLEGTLLEAVGRALSLAVGARQAGRQAHEKELMSVYSISLRWNQRRRSCIAATKLRHCTVHWYCTVKYMEHRGHQA